MHAAPAIQLPEIENVAPDRSVRPTELPRWVDGTSWLGALRALPLAYREQFDKDENDAAEELRLAVNAGLANRDQARHYSRKAQEERPTRTKMRQESPWKRLSDLAGAVGVDRSTLSRLERRPSSRWKARQLELAVLVARQLGVSLEEYRKADGR